MRHRIVFRSHRKDISTLLALRSTNVYEKFKQNGHFFKDDGF